jgi:hypothetical protein
MLRRDAKYGDEMKKRAAEFGAKVDKADIPEVTRAELKQKLADYQRDFFAWFDSAQKLAVESKATSDSFSEIEPVIAAVTKAVSEMRAEADQANMRMRDITDWQMKLAIVVIAFSVLGIGVLIGRSVSRQLLAITGALGELAGGNFKVVLPRLGRTDEIGEMAGAAEVFRSALVETDRLRAEQSQRSSGRCRSARPICVGLPTISRLRSARSFNPFQPLPLNWRRPPVLSPRARCAPKNSQPASRVHQKKPPATCSRWPRPPKNCIRRSTRSVVRSNNRRAWPMKLWSRRARPTTVSANFPRRLAASATWSN